MSSILDDNDAPVKALLIGKSGAGKTGAQASLVAEGYKLRIIDTDKGVRPLRSLLTDPHYPYAALIKKRNIDLNEAVRYVSIDTSMKLRTVSRRTPDQRTSSETILAPVDARAWTKVLDLMDKWKDGEKDFGSVRSWGADTVLSIDSFSTLAKCAYYFNQSLNGRLGSREEGNDYRRDVGGAQAQLTRLLELLYDSSIHCHVLVISHITWVDESQGVAARPKEGETVISNPDGYPSAIGRALSPHMGKYFNDVFVSTSSGSGSAVRRTISTVPQEGVMAKNSAWMEREYPVASGLAQIFAAIRGQPAPKELIEACAPRRAVAPAPTSSPVRQTSPAPAVA